MNDAWEPPRMPETARPRDQTIARLGAGGMAEVFLIRRTGPGGFEKFLALKRIRAGLDAETFAPMLLDEARLVAALQHPNIVQVHDAGADDDGLWFLMEYVHGRSLGAVISRALDRGVFVPLECAAYIVACVARALHYAHHAESATQERLGVIHRDVSPGNILVGFDGVVKLADFGIARANQRHAQTQDGTFKGKYGYAAPEQCRGESLDGGSDLFSLGIVMHELVSLRHLFSSDAPLATVEAVMHAPIPSLCAIRDDVPPEIDSLVRHMLERVRAARIGSGAEIADQLDGIVHRLGLRATRERMADLMSQLFTQTEMRLQVPPPAQQESMHTPLRSPALGTPVRTTGQHAARSPQHSAVTEALSGGHSDALSDSASGARRLAHSSQPGASHSAVAASAAAGSQVGAPLLTAAGKQSGRHPVLAPPTHGERGSLSPQLSVSYGAPSSSSGHSQPGAMPLPGEAPSLKKPSALPRIAVAAVVGALSAVGVTLLLREPAKPAAPVAPAAPAVVVPATGEGAEERPAPSAAGAAPLAAPGAPPITSPGTSPDTGTGTGTATSATSPVEASASPPAGTPSTAPSGSAAPAATSRRPHGKPASKSSHGKPANKGEPGKKKPSSDESLLERDW